MTEEISNSNGSSTNPHIGSDFLEFLQEQCGGKEAAHRAFLKHSLRSLFNGRQSNTVTMGEILDRVENQGWTEWLRETSILDFLRLFSIQTTPTIKNLDNAERSPRITANVQERIDKLMAEFEKTPWISKPDLGKLLGLKSTPTIDKVVNEALSRGLIKKHRGRTMLYAKATETCPPPN